MIYFTFNTLLICVARQVKNVSMVLALDNQDQFREFTGCFTQLPAFYKFGNTSNHHNGKPTIYPFTL